MIIVVKPDHREEDRRQLLQTLRTLGLSVHESAGAKQTIFGAVGRQVGGEP